jgi:hypothetical protein
VSVTLLAVALTACDPPEPPPDGPAVEIAEGPCGRALYVVATDYQSSSVSIVGYDGAMLSASMLSSASEAPGLTVALSGDVVAPTARAPGARAVIVDRYPASVVTLLDPARAEVELQINVQTGFAANPQDVIEARAGVLYVSRYESNRMPGAVPFDQGGDLLAVDPGTGAVVGRVDLAAAMQGEAADILPRPSRMIAAGGRVYVLLSAYSADFTKSGDARVAVVDPVNDTLVGHAVLQGSRGCSGLAVSPDGARLAVGCSGTFGGTSTPTLDDAGLVVVRRADDGSVSPERRFPAADIGGEPLAFSVDFASVRTILYATLGRLDEAGAPEQDDILFEIDVETGEHTELLRSAREPFSLGDVRCSPGCGVCFVADASRGALHRLEVDGGGRAGSRREISFDDGTGLPPRYVGAY